MQQFLVCLSLFLLLRYSQACFSSNTTITSMYALEGPVDPNSNCVIQLNYNDTQYTRVIVQVTNMKPTDSIVFTHGNSLAGIEVDGSKGNATMTFSFPPPSTRIVIKTAQDSILRVNITVTPFNWRSLQAAPSTYESYWELKTLNQMSFYMAMCLTGSKAAFAVAYPNQDPAVDSYQLSNIFVYDGNQKIGTTFLGTLYDFKTGTFVAATTASLVFYVADSVDIDGVIIITDKTNYEAFSQYNVIWAQTPTNGFQSYELVSDRDQAAVTIFNAPSSGNDGIYLTGVGNLQNNPSVLSYYNGPLQNQSRMVLLMNYQVANTLPQHFEGISRTFIINGTSRATLTWTSDVAQTKQTLGYDGRFGFIATPNYPISGSDNLDSVGINLISATNDPIYVDLWYKDCQQISAVTIVANLDTGVVAYDVCSYLTFENNVPFSGRNLQITVHDNSTMSPGTFLYYQVSTTANAPTIAPRTTQSTSHHGGSGTTKTPGGAGNSLFTDIQMVLLVTALLVRC